MQENDSGTVKGLFVGLAIGFIAGAVTALFLTTKTGEERRADIKKVALDIRNRAEEKASNIKNMSKEKYSEIVENVLAGYKKVKDLTEKEIELIKKIVIEQKEVVSK